MSRGKTVTTKLSADLQLMPGVRVNYHSVIGGPVTTSGHKVERIVILNGRVLVRITGKPALVAIEALSRED